MSQLTKNMPIFDSTIKPESKEEHDFTNSEIINNLSIEDIFDYFGSKENAVNFYKKILTSGYPRSAALLIAKVISGSITKSGQSSEFKALLEELSMLPVHEIVDDIDRLISKIKKPSRKNKIMFCSGHWLTGGMERVMSILFSELKNDFEIYLLTPYEEKPSQINIPNYVTSIKISNELFVNQFDSLILSYALILDIDVVVGFINMFSKQLNFYNICVGTKIKTIASNHEYYFYPYKSEGHYEVVKKRLNAFANCSAIIWPLNFNAALCGLYVDNNYVIGNPNNPHFTAKNSKVTEDKIVLSVGRFNDYVKRIDRILECFSLVIKKVPDAKLVLVGKYDNESPIKPNDRTTVNDLIKILAIPRDSIEFIGEVDNVHDYYAQASVLLLTSNSEGFGMVVNEAAQFGVPSVCNYIPGIEDIVANGRNGFITPQNDISSMATKVCDILTNGKLKNMLGSNAKSRVRSFDAKLIGDKWRFLIHSLIEVKDKDILRKKLESKLKYDITDAQLLSKVLANELNEIFYMTTERKVQHINFNLVLSKIIGLPSRLRANIKYEGFFNTTKKVATRSYRILRNKLQKFRK